MRTTATTVDPPSPRMSRIPHRGDPGAWSWALHRISGVAIFFFLLVHVLDTAMVRVSPQAYNTVVGIYQTPIAGLMEFGVVAAVLFHALNGLRVIVIDAWPRAGRYRRLLTWVNGGLFTVLIVAAGVVLAVHVLEHLR